MLSRFIFKPSHLRYLSLISSKPQFINPKPISKTPSFPISNLYFFPRAPRFYSTDNGDKDSPDLWKFSSETDQTIDSVFSEEADTFDHSEESVKVEGDNTWLGGVGDSDGKVDGEIDIFKGVENEGDGGGGEEWATAEGYKAWDFTVGDEENAENVFDIGAEDLGLKGFDEQRERSEKSEQMKQLESEEKALTAIIKGPNRAFGDLIAASGITDEMLDSLIALKDLDGIQGLPPLREIEDMRYEKNTRKSTRAEIERQKQEEFARARVREVDTKGRAYGTGKRKCSVARVWIQPGDGKFIVNDKEFDVYFPMLDHRASLLRPFSETKTLGMWDINCTVKGGGVSGQVGAVRLGISRALQNWDPNLRPPLREAGFLTRDSRVVERKKPGKAKARKSFQWVKR